MVISSSYGTEHCKPNVQRLLSKNPQPVISAVITGNNSNNNSGEISATTTVIPRTLRQLGFPATEVSSNSGFVSARLVQRKQYDESVMIGGDNLYSALKYSGNIKEIPKNAVIMRSSNNNINIHLDNSLTSTPLSQLKCGIGSPGSNASSSSAGEPLTTTNSGDTSFSRPLKDIGSLISPEGSTSITTDDPSPRVSSLYSSISSSLGNSPQHVVNDRASSRNGGGHGHHVASPSSSLVSRPSPRVVSSSGGASIPRVITVKNVKRATCFSKSVQVAISVQHTCEECRRLWGNTISSSISNRATNGGTTMSSIIGRRSLGVTPQGETPRVEQQPSCKRNNGGELMTRNYSSLESAGSGEIISLTEVWSSAKSVSVESTTGGVIDQPEDIILLSSPDQTRPPTLSLPTSRTEPPTVSSSRLIKSKVDNKEVATQQVPATTTENHHSQAVLVDLTPSALSRCNRAAVERSEILMEKQLRESSVILKSPWKTGVPPRPKSAGKLPPRTACTPSSFLQRQLAEERQTPSVARASGSRKRDEETAGGSSIPEDELSTPLEGTRPAPPPTPTPTRDSLRSRSVGTKNLLHSVSNNAATDSQAEPHRLCTRKGTGVAHTPPPMRHYRSSTSGVIQRLYCERMQNESNDEGKGGGSAVLPAADRLNRHGSKTSSSSGKVHAPSKRQPTPSKIRDPSRSSPSLSKRLSNNNNNICVAGSSSSTTSGDKDNWLRSRFSSSNC